ncbi:MAG: PTS sugar transporter subunit IIC [Acholeplasmatales bacterium]|nr:PTS sugar transporter subunit IIC [Acholeplasmatales bacterium]
MENQNNNNNYNNNNENQDTTIEIAEVQTPLKAEKRVNLKKIKEFASKSMSGMVWGLFATLLIGTILTQIASISGYSTVQGATNNSFVSLIYGIGTMLKSLLGIGMGIGMGIAMKFTNLQLVSLSLAGAVATTFRVTFKEGIVIGNFVTGFNNDPVIVYLVVLIVGILMTLVFTKKTPFDLLILPLFCVISAAIITFLLSPEITWILQQIGSFLSWAMNGSNGNSAPVYQKIIFASIIGVTVGVLLTLPISSAAICIAINLTGLGAGAALVGCCTQMVGFAIQSIRENKIGIFFSVFFGTSMVFFPKIVKKPLIWLPTIIASAILSPIAVLVFDLQSSKIGAGMGTCGLVGPLQTLETMGYSLDAWLGIIIFCILAPALVVFLLDLLFRKLNIIKKGDLKLDF